jgi:hypothetical protein
MPSFLLILPYAQEMYWDRPCMSTSVADPDPESGAFLTPGSGIRNRFFSGSRISGPYFSELSDHFWGKQFYNPLKIGPNFFFFSTSKLKEFSILRICGYIKRYDN